MGRPIIRMQSVSHRKHCLLWDEATLPLTSQSVCFGIEYPCGTCNQILFPVGMLLSEICGLVSGGRPLWREDGSAICSLITQLSESLRTRNLILQSHLRLPQPGGPGSRIYIPQEQGGPVIPPGTGFSLDRFCSKDVLQRTTDYYNFRSLIVNQMKRKLITYSFDIMVSNQEIMSAECVIVFITNWVAAYWE
jgi:hypothetical protein